MAISTVAQAELKDAIKTELEVEFGTSQDAATLLKYADAMSRAIAEKMFAFGYFPDDTEYPPTP